MHIIAGKFKGKKLITLEGKNTRPTLTRIKENIFNILQNYCDFNELVTVDLFGGSGSLSCESLSRGVKFAYINDNNFEAYQIITQNINNCGFNKQAKIYNLDYKIFLNSISEAFDLLFIDPPFANLDCQQWVIDYLNTCQKINDNALIVLETNIELNNLVLNSHFKVISNKKYGKIYIKIIQFQRNRMDNSNAN